jgi:hypothetical protein
MPTLQAAASQVSPDSHVQILEHIRNLDVGRQEPSSATCGLHSSPMSSFQTSGCAAM